jgi:hypothetical protein
MFTVVDKVIDHSKGIYWYRIDISNSDLRNWLVKQPSRLWCHIEFSNYGDSYTINEELYTLLQLTWGDQ